jgi:predicted alpha/beta hydrolase family esterase
MSKIDLQKHQVIFIRGGDCFETKDEFYTYLKNREYNPYENRRNWRDWLEWSLSEEFDAFTPLMPNKQWADYEAWKIWFEKLFPYINHNEDVQLVIIGQSLGAIFLTKYLSENVFPKKINQLHLVSPIFDNEGLVSGKMKIGNFSFDSTKLDNLSVQADNLFLYHSTDDPLVPYQHSLHYLEYLPSAKFFSFDGRGHFDQPAFMEILQVISENLQK